jgi:hypothetical protein
MNSYTFARMTYTDQYAWLSQDRPFRACAVETSAVWRRKIPMNIIQTVILCGAAWLVAAIGVGMLLGRILRVTKP